MKRPSMQQSMKCQVCSKLADLPADLPPQYWHPVVKDGNRAHTGRSSGISNPPIDLPVNGNFRFLLYEIFLADQVAYLPPLQSSIEALNPTTPNQLIGTSSYWQIKWQIYPPINHRSLEHNYTKSGDMY